VLKLFFAFKGVLSRQQFFSMALVLFILGSVSWGLVDYANQAFIYEQITERKAQVLTLLGLGGVLITQFSMLTLIIRRLRDIGWSRWWLLLLLIPPVSFLFLLVLFFKPSSKITS